jgi:hypothetical protein
MSLQAVHQVIKDVRDEFMADGIPAVEINLGLCADFADAVWTELKAQGIAVDVCNLDDYWAFDGEMDAASLARRNAIQLPPGLDWGMLTEMAVADNASHTWIEFEGKFFDAERPNGIDTPFEFPCVRHALTEILERDDRAMAALVAAHGWWRDAMRTRVERETLAPQRFTQTPFSTLLGVNSVPDRH